MVAAGTTNTVGKLAALPELESTDEYIFEGWYTAANGGEQITVDTVFSGDQTVYARYISC